MLRKKIKKIREFLKFLLFQQNSTLVFVQHHNSLDVRIKRIGTGYAF